MPLILYQPPWQQKIFSSIIAAMGRQLKQSVKVFHSFMLNLRLPRKNKNSGGDHNHMQVGLVGDKMQLVKCASSLYNWISAFKRYFYQSVCSWTTLLPVSQKSSSRHKVWCDTDVHLLRKNYLRITSETKEKEIMTDCVHNSFKCTGINSGLELMAQL